MMSCSPADRVYLTEMVSPVLSFVNTGFVNGPEIVMMHGVGDDPSFCTSPEPVTPSVNGNVNGNLNPPANAVNSTRYNVGS